MSDSLIIDLEGCARCLGDGHPGLEFRRLTHPADTTRGIIFTHWATCPVNGEPIFYAKLEMEPPPLAHGKPMVDEAPGEDGRSPLPSAGIVAGSTPTPHEEQIVPEEEE